MSDPGDIGEGPSCCDELLPPGTRTLLICIAWSDFVTGVISLNVWPDDIVSSMYPVCLEAAVSRDMHGTGGAQLE